MKAMKFGVLIAAVFVLQGVYAGTDQPIDVKELPNKVQTFIKTHFPNEQVSLAKRERDLFETRYEVLFVNSVKLEFLGNGEWEEVDCRYQAVPDAIVPPQILTSVRERYPDAKIVEINRDKRDYELKLANGLELVYDLQYRLVDIDD
jgi:hypothetical protein